jgi:hypothetical protein
MSILIGKSTKMYEILYSEWCTVSTTLNTSACAVKIEMCYVLDQ